MRVKATGADYVVRTSGADNFVRTCGADKVARTNGADNPIGADTNVRTTDADTTVHMILHVSKHRHRCTTCIDTGMSPFIKFPVVVYVTR